MIEPTGRDATPNDAIEMPVGAIAIVGMAGRFPGAPDVATFWQNLLAGRESICDLAPADIDDDFDAETRAASTYVKRRPILDGIENFDAAFFGMSAREAQLTDPQQRVFLECAYAALEDAGTVPGAAGGPIGIFAGSALNTYFLRHVCGERSRIRQFTSGFQVGHYQELLGAMQDFVASRVAYKLNLKGPAVTVQSACSTSLLAVAQACQSLQLYQCDAALAGGVSISVPQHRGYECLEGGMVSADGHVRPFDAEANGTVFGSGCGVVVLRRLEDAVARGDRIYAVIRGAGINNDGADKVGFTAPSVAGQADVIRLAHANAGVVAGQIGYVEAHGTATPLGDPIEFRALEMAFNDASVLGGTCVIGSVKANVGHLDAAAGVTGLIKAALQLHHETMAPQINFATANPAIDLTGGPFRVTTVTEGWARSARSRMAGVSAFGVGGTNVHLVLEEAPRPLDATVSEAARLPAILPLSAKTTKALAAMASRLARTLEGPDAPLLVDAAETLARGRRAYSVRAAIVARDNDEAVARLDQLAKSAVDKSSAAAAQVIFMFPGQGAQYPGMTAGLYTNQPVFAEWIDRGARLAEASLGRDIRALLFDICVDDESAPHALRDTTLAQPALFIVEYALAQLWMSRGVTPAALIGHSLGEFVAAALAGVFSFEDGLRVVIARGLTMQRLPKGGMLAVRAPLTDVLRLLEHGVDIAAINASNLMAVAGPHDALDAFTLRTEAARLVTRRLHTSHAFHSAMMDPAIEELQALFTSLPLSAPRIPIASCVTGTWMTAADATSPAYWARHCRVTVQFADALMAAVARTEDTVLIEVGPGRTLATFARQSSMRDKLHAVIASVPEFADRTDDCLVLATATAQLWEAGVAVDLPCTAGGRHVSLPSYPFAATRHWIELDPGLERVVSMPPAVAPLPATVSALPSPYRLPVASERSAIEPSALLNQQIRTLLEDLSGEPIGIQAESRTFLELGFDSLMLGQVAQRLQKMTGVKIAFRQLMGDIPTIDALAKHLAALMPEQPADVPSDVLIDLQAKPAQVAARAAIGGSNAMDVVIREQLAAMERVFEQQLRALQANVGGTSAPEPDVVQSEAGVSTKTAGDLLIEDVVGGERFRMFEQRSRMPDGFSALTPAQQNLIAEVIGESDAKFAASKADTQSHRRAQADPRSASGFRSEWKDLIYPLVVDRSSGSKLWDVDGNEFVDLVNGFGQTMFGHAPEFITDAIRHQLDAGFAIGPQTPLAGEVAAALTKMLGHERIAFCNTGSEAVMAAMRVARAVTGRIKIVFFGGDYHGQFDEVLAKGLSRRAALPGAQPAASGIAPEAVANMVVLPYDAPDSLAYIREHAHELAAVLVEPVQSRHPALVPEQFLRDLRTITAQAGVALIFDEVVTGFRVHAAGVQGLFGITADLATYGKVLGGGMPIGVLAGSAAYLDALDGGQWKFGDASVPEVAPTFFAGTFVRHPLTLAAAKAVIAHLQSGGPQLQARLSATTSRLTKGLNTSLERRHIRSRIETFSSFFYFNLAADDTLASLLYPLMRLGGVHIAEGFPCFLTTAHSAADIDRIVQAFDTALDRLQAVGILAPSMPFGMMPPRLAPLVAKSAETLRFAPTEAQREIYLAAQFGGAASCAFNESVSVAIDGDIDVVAIGAALGDIVERHESLRGHFGATGETMTIDAVASVEMAVVDCGGELDPMAAFAQMLKSDATMPFDLVHGPLVRAQLVTLGSRRRILILTAHHIICDGWSMGTLTTELLAFYRMRTAGIQPDLLPVLPFHMFARDEAATAKNTEATRLFWADMYRDLPEGAELPADRARPLVRAWSGATLTESLDGALTKAVKQTAMRNGATLFSLLFASLQVMLGRLSDASDVVLSVPMAAQTKLDCVSLIGHCVNFLPVRRAFDPDASFATHLKDVHATMLGVLAHQDYTLGTLVRDLKVTRSLGRTPLGDVQFNLERHNEGLSIPGATIALTPNPKAAVNFDLFFNFIESRDGLRIDVDYNTDLYDAATVRRWIGHLRTLLTSISGDAQQAIARVDLLSVGERRWLIDDLNATRRVFGRESTVHALIEMQADRSPDDVAVCCGGRVMSYRELDQSANRVAHRLLRLAPDTGCRIAVAVDRSIDMIVALLGVMKAGHAYVPLDPTHPGARLKQTLAMARVSALITSDVAAAAWAGSEVPVLALGKLRDELERERDDRPAVPLSGNQLAAYVIFTSGSTGTPKGVEVGHRSVVNFLQSMAETPGFTARDHLLAVTTVCFDIAGLEFWLPLTTGGSLTLAEREDLQDGFALAKLIDRCGATVIQATPSSWQLLIEAGFVPRADLKMLCGGEPLPRDLADRLSANGGRLWNLYGPTETTIWSSVGQVARGPITIGAPIANTQLFVLDTRQRLQPVGVPGELYIGGDGLAHGYFERPDLTEAAFLIVEIAPGQSRRLYRTGDIAIRRADGSLQLFGRRDQQVKLRGYRIELEEIEGVLRSVPNVSAAAVAVRNEGAAGPRLVAFIVPAVDADIDQKTLTAHASARLPSYMVPSLWVRVGGLPRTGNGKLDRKALLQLPMLVPSDEAATKAPPGAAAELPVTRTEEIIAAVWCEVLGLATVRRDVTIIDLGADSLDIFRIAARLHAKGLPMQARDLLANPTVARQAALIDRAQTLLSSRLGGSDGTRRKVPSLADFRLGAMRNRQTR